MGAAGRDEDNLARLLVNSPRPNPLGVGKSLTQNAIEEEVLAVNRTAREWNKSALAITDDSFAEQNSLVGHSFHVVN